MANAPDDHSEKDLIAPGQKAADADVAPVPQDLTAEGKAADDAVKAAGVSVEDEAAVPVARADDAVIETPAPTDDADRENTPDHPGTDVLENDEGARVDGSAPVGNPRSGEALDATDGESEGAPKVTVPDSSDEVPALLGGSAVDESEKQEIVPEPPAEKGASAMAGEPVSSAAENHGVEVELAALLQSQKDSLAQTQALSSGIQVVSNDTACLIQQLNSLSNKHDFLAAELEAFASGVGTKNVLSKTFLILSSVLVALLAAAQMYMFVSLLDVQRVQNAAGASLLGNLNAIAKKMADYDKNLTKAVEAANHQQHAQQNGASAEKTGHDAAGGGETGAPDAASVRVKLNRLRNGVPEMKLIRKETGDWFVYTKKTLESISDVEIIEVLNQAYKKSGRQLTTNIPLPAHNALCLLKADGKGGTEVVMTKDFLP